MQVQESKLNKIKIKIKNKKYISKFPPISLKGWKNKVRKESSKSMIWGPFHGLELALFVWVLVHSII